MRLLVISASLFLFFSCKSKSDIELQQYYIQGEVLYTKYCGNCHQEDGSGLGLLYPPINKSDFIDNNFPEVICIMRYGKSTPTVVNGKTFNQPMKGIAALTDLDVAEIATYIYNNWDRRRGIVKVEEVAAEMNKCKQE
ncbi:MAG TPA: cytochrome c [Cyclobacteriaceae bacterium]|nr:cytochrome c [Cyclobacteriaceae bacterium]